ncbi:unnamed protein product, partial [Meganyctiphanes norvegica]
QQQQQQQQAVAGQLRQPVPQVIPPQPQLQQPQQQSPPHQPQQHTPHVQTPQNGHSITARPSALTTVRSNPGVDVMSVVSSGSSSGGSAAGGVRRPSSASSIGGHSQHSQHSPTMTSSSSKDFLANASTELNDFATQASSLFSDIFENGHTCTTKDVTPIKH